MGQTHDEITQNLAERLCWQVARRDDCRVARRLYRKPLGDGVYRLDEGALLDDFCHFLQAIGVMTLLEQADGAAIQRQIVPFVQYPLPYGVKTLFGIQSINALPSLLFSDEALMQTVHHRQTLSPTHVGGSAVVYPGLPEDLSPPSGAGAAVWGGASAQPSSGCMSSWWCCGRRCAGLGMPRSGP
jgi:hypothetical protein